MNVYKITITRSAQKQLDKLPNNIADRLIDAIYDLSENPRPPGHKKLKSRMGYRIRIGDYRVIYEIFDDELLISVIAIGDRKDIYN